MSNSNLGTVKCNDMDYAIYKIGTWKNEYKLNIIGISDEIPVTIETKKHVLFNMEQIRKSEFDIDGKSVNGLVALGRELSPKLKSEPLENIIALEEKEYENIVNEINNLPMKNDEDVINFNSEDYLIYKLVKEEHSITASQPANQFTMNHHLNDIKKLKNQVNK